MEEDFNALLKQHGFGVQTRQILCFYFKPDILRAVVDAMRGGDTDVDPMQSEPEEIAR